MGQKLLRAGKLRWRPIALPPLENWLKIGLKDISKTYGIMAGYAACTGRSALADVFLTCS